jgi:hypothetical protein
MNTIAVAFGTNEIELFVIVAIAAVLAWVCWR